MDRPILANMNLCKLKNDINSSYLEKLMNCITLGNRQ